MSANTKTEAYLQGYYDAYNFRPFNYNGYNEIEYLKGYKDGHKRIHFSLKDIASIKNNKRAV